MNASHTTLVVIPARFASTRFPGKPLAMVAGVSMIQRVWAIACAVPGVDKVCVATDDGRIEAAVRAFGGDVVMTSDACRNGTERAAEALAHLGGKADVVLNLQGDAVLTPPWILAPVVAAFADVNVQMATPAVELSSDQIDALKDHKKQSPASGTTVTTDLNGNALYFSKMMLPFRRNADGGAPMRRHIGIYGYRADTLSRLVALPETPLEKTEGLEQLRALEHGIPIRVVNVDYQGRTHWSIDAEADVNAAEALIEREGELLPAYDGTVRL